ncbi:DUF2267 domain-containing protein [Occallatibacter savannae]|uniref:DUF2267 domain-containing protein n=1 Tax=Occallatibacter savannae TaxID=1002691 RepID=UPI000D686A4C|nr:DUF2267 domain-containing protein [Occallatibacter savannae]
MTVPTEYQQANIAFYNFLTDVRDQTNFDSTHPAYTIAQGVFQAFRRRLGIRDAIRFCNVLPVGLRALFVADWDPDEPLRCFEDRDTMTREVQNLRPLHNYAPDDAIQMVARALRRNVDREVFDRVLTTLPEGAADFWKV